MAELFTNNAFSRLASSIAVGSLSVILQTGDGALFPNPGVSDFFRAVLFKKTTGEWEIVFCTTRGGDILTITRAQEGTTPVAFNADDVIELRPTAGFFQSLSVTSVNIQDNLFKRGADTGVADAYIITPTPVIASYAYGQEFYFIPTNTNTGAPVTLQVSGIVAPPNIKLIDGSDPYPGALTAGRLAHVVHDGANYVLQNPHEKSYYLPNVTAPVLATNEEIDRLTASAIPYDLIDDTGASVLKRISEVDAVNGIAVSNAATGQPAKIQGYGEAAGAGLIIEGTGDVSNVDINSAGPAGRVRVNGESVEFKTGTVTTGSIANNGNGALKIAHGFGDELLDIHISTTVPGTNAASVLVCQKIGGFFGAGPMTYNTPYSWPAVVSNISSIPTFAIGEFGVGIRNESGVAGTFTLTWTARRRT